MGPKRTREPETGRDGAGVQGPSSKRYRRNQANGPDGQHEAAIDATYGQRSVFPRMGQSTVPSDDDLECEDEHEALAYLQSVRQEASGIPHLLVAPKAGPQLPSVLRSDLGYDDEGPPGSASYSDGAGDERGYYRDGAYTAAPDEPDEIDLGANGGSVDDATSRAYYAAVGERFLFLREQLEREPPEDIVAALPRSHTPNVGIKSSTHRIWTFRLENTDPLPAQIAALDRGVALVILRVLLQGKFLRHGEAVTERTSRWLWSLLARLPDRGEMDYTEIGGIRDLGKRAVLLMTSSASMELLREQAELNEGDGAGVDDAAFVDEEEAGSESMDEGSPGGTGEEAEPEKAEPAAGDKQQPADDNGNESMEEGEVSEPSTPRDDGSRKEEIRRRLLASLDEAGTAATDTQADQADGPAAPDKVRAEMNRQATLNMILTIAGEFYGQRDLLPFRSPFTTVM